MQSGKIPEDRRKQLKEVIEHFDSEDIGVRERQLRLYKRLKYYWDGLNNLYWSEIAHDWKIYDAQLQAESDVNQDFYDKRVNVFRAYLESIIAALSVTVPAVICFPDDAENAADIETAQAGDIIGKLVYRHNDVTLLWLHALYVFVTEGMIVSRNYTHHDKEYGEIEIPEYKAFDETIQVEVCSLCGSPIGDNNPQDEFDPMGIPTIPICANCGMEIVPELRDEKIVITRLVGHTSEPKGRQKIEVYGGINVKVATYAKNQSETPYLRFSEDLHFSYGISKYPELREKLFNATGDLQGESQPYERWARLSTQYNGEYPENTVTFHHHWLRPCAFEVLKNEEDVKWWKTQFPSGVASVHINDLFAECKEEALDDHWTIAQNPLSDYLQFDPLGQLLTSIQEITNDLISLTLQTIEHGVAMTFADPDVLDFQAFRTTEVLPGGVYPAKPKTGKSVGDAFHDLKTASLSAEILPFGQKVQELGQITSGALPSLFGGNLEGSKTAAEYSMSRAQALQRLQTTWKMLTAWWKGVFGKVIPAYMKCIAEDERFVERDTNGRFVNVVVRKQRLEGKIGRIELEAAEQVPVSWAQQKDVVMQLLQTNHPGIIEALLDPANIPAMKAAIGLDNFKIPGQDDRTKQYEEIRMLLDSEPIIDEMSGIEAPSVDIEPLIDNNVLQSDICRQWAISEAGRLAKIENPAGYKNVLLHMQRHIEVTQAMQMMNAPQNAQPNQEDPGAKPETEEVVNV